MQKVKPVNLIVEVIDKTLGLIFLGLWFGVEIIKLLLWRIKK